MYVLEGLMKKILISLPHIIILYMMSTSYFSHHVPYAHIFTYFFEAVQVSLCLCGRPLSVTNTVDMDTLKAMKYRYIFPKQRWIQDEEILKDEHYDNYESSHESDPNVDFDECDYLDYSFLYPHGNDGDDQV
ncbi:hypothetical protein Scep_021726 [Stephania cephalantha]|uniref:Uncharacterized protein n=1 Tax=Stephania cephalantha TaxID=152367 RepID=A0AAP0F9H6_9MAGN